MSRVKQSSAMAQRLARLEAEDRTVACLEKLPPRVAFATALAAGAFLAEKWLSEQSKMMQRGDARDALWWMWMSAFTVARRVGMRTLQKHRQRFDDCLPESAPAPKISDLGDERYADKHTCIGVERLRRPLANRGSPAPDGVLRQMKE
jgi:hypothetical protein